MPPTDLNAPPPRLYCILATESPRALVFRRGPSSWFHLLRWNLDDGTLESGVWVRKKLFPTRCDLSGDGELLLYLLSGAVRGRYRVFGGVSRAPWLHPLSSWDEHDTWGWGSCFVNSATPHTWGEPRTIDLNPGRLTIQHNDAVPFVNERRRGWTEAPDRPADTWDESRDVILQKRRPQGDCLLRMIGGRDRNHTGVDGLARQFELQWDSGAIKQLVGLAWADWDHQGRLLTATRSGFLRVSSLVSGKPSLIQEHDLRVLTPNPQPPPEWAQRPNAARRQISQS